jgi:hypothetical protein
MKSKALAIIFTMKLGHLILKANLLDERDEARKQKFEKLNNEVLPKVARDKQVMIGCKEGSKSWIRLGDFFPFLASITADTLYDVLIIP